MPSSGGYYPPLSQIFTAYEEYVVYYKNEEGNAKGGSVSPLLRIKPMYIARKTKIIDAKGIENFL